MVSQKVKDIILDAIDFENPEILAAVENVVTASFDLADSGNKFDLAFANLPEAAEQISDGILELSRAFSSVVNPDKNQVVKEAFGKVFTAVTPEQEIAGEGLFSSALDFNLAATKLNDRYKVVPPAE